jgi:cystathionine beta-lyase
LILDGGRHIPAATLGPEVADRTITLMAPSKTFNVPGLNCAFAIIPNEGLRTKFKHAREGIVPGNNALGYAACLAAYRDGEPWRLALLAYLRANKDIVYRFINEQIPPLSMDDVQATYLAWIDAAPLGLSHPKRFFEQAGVELFDGRHFGSPGHVRLNFGCPRRLLLEALDRMKRAVMTLANSP